MYNILPNLVLAFHGCDQTTFEKVLYQHKNLLPSTNTYDWLGNGIYFWENSLERAYQWAEQSCKRYNIKHPDKPKKIPAVIGAVISLGNCLNLADYNCNAILKSGFALLKSELELNQKGLPKNRNIPNNTDILYRDLDCAVIERIHQYNREMGFPSFDSVRGLFLEGDPVYENSGIKEKTHIQLCIVNPNCIKGYFKPIAPDKKWTIV